MNVPKLTQEQKDWLSSQTKNKDIIFMSFHGSHLYGLDRPESDIDVKAVYAPSKTDLLLGKATKTYNYKNDDLDIELELKSLPSFLLSAESCDTNCIDLLFAPDAVVMTITPLWETIKQHRGLLLSKTMRGMVGYIKTHTHKYSNKIDRLVEMKSLLAFAESVGINDVVANVANHLPQEYKYIKNVTVVTDHEQKYLEVCGKKYIHTWEVRQLTDALCREIARYGKRTEDGETKGLDTKSLSHALRVLVQLKELVLERNITFPLKNAEYIKAVKRGFVTDVDEVMSTIHELYEECMVLLKQSDLPEQSDLSVMFKALEKYYFD
ncbi:nucleotidyltransferase [Rheinheimera phage vB_RspM_Barba19A]|jgi:hypothetical protein|uniref:Nucleotidyltransferase n=2 Tax=Barbavirus barba19A TaxID=2734091 RepID=A0A4P8N4P3_9CAUD|nr:nucleotidyltransferase [Rheinheimera phage vB_RspM_Barba19A]QCQ61901.1 nucleotidyltransferase [Rheinheimera phage vB_RspM_Barba19A]QCQ64651.1 nucleotidyltransferase [Rheinheimera phage vB_RspM_Barba31A]